MAHDAKQHPEQALPTLNWLQGAISDIIVREATKGCATKGLKGYLSDCETCRMITKLNELLNMSYELMSMQDTKGVENN